MMKIRTQMKIAGRTKTRMRIRTRTRMKIAGIMKTRRMTPIEMPGRTRIRTRIPMKIPTEIPGIVKTIIPIGHIRVMMIMRMRAATRIK
jgi:hypothetical protein